MQLLIWQEYHCPLLLPSFIKKKKKKNAGLVLNSTAAFNNALSKSHFPTAVNESSNFNYLKTVE